MSDPVIIPPTCQILCAAEVPNISCNTAYMWSDLESDFTVPGLTGTADIAVCNSAQWAVGAYVWIRGAGIFEISARPTATSIRVINNGDLGNVAPASVIGSGAAVLHIAPPEKVRWLEDTATWNPGSIPDGDEEVKEVTVTGAVLGDFVIASFSLDVADLTLTACVTAADTVTAQLCNNTGGAIDLASGTIRVRVMPQS